jgi:four helix bundle suffix protein
MQGTPWQTQRTSRTARTQTSDSTPAEPLIPVHGGYRKLKSFKVAQLVYDITVRFCNRYVARSGRMRDQMVQAARSGVQNIAEGSLASGTSRKTELKLTSVARASLEELKLDYEDYLRQRNLPQWERSDPRRADLVQRRLVTVDEFVAWVREVHAARSAGSAQSAGSAHPGQAEIAANGALAQIAVASALLERQLKSQAAAFEREGGFTERLFRVRAARRSRA